MRQKRSLGQIFLKDQRYIQKILAKLSLSGQVVLEIGSGNGVISGFLAQNSKQLYCLEVDQYLCQLLKKKFRGNKNVQIIHDDILKFPLGSLGKNILIFGNVPYQISTALIKYLISHREHIQGAYLTLQKEFVQKLTAKHSSNHYCFLGCWTQYYAETIKLFDIPAAAFNPVPKVDSTFIKINFYRKSPYKVRSEDLLFRVIRKAFTNRRKKIINSLLIPGDRHKFFSRLGINPSLRAENISLNQYVAITNQLYPADENFL